MLVAEELECDWAGVRAELVSASENAARGRVWGDMVATNSISIRGSQEYLRKAGAQARTMLIAEAAERWKVPPAECTARNSIIRHGPSGRGVRFSEVALAASERAIPAEVTLKDPREWRLIGTSGRTLLRVMDDLVRQGARALIIPTMDVERWGEFERRMLSVKATIASMQAPPHH